MRLAGEREPKRLHIEALVFYKMKNVKKHPVLKRSTLSIKSFILINQIHF